jgi:hypothetical protein
MSHISSLELRNIVAELRSAAAGGDRQAGINLLILSLEVEQALATCGMYARPSSSRHWWKRRPPLRRRTLTAY